MSEAGVPSPDEILDAPGATCANLTPLIKAKMSALGSGGVLEVRSDDPAAREGVPAWSRLTGNALIGALEEDELRTRFFLQKK